MKKEYENVREFCDDCHNSLSIKQIVLSMGILTTKDFKGDFVKCIFHENDDTPSLQIKEAFFKCYACGAKGDIFKFLQLYYNLDFYEAVKYLANFLNITIKDMRYQYDGKIEKLKAEWEEYKTNLENADERIKALQRDYFPEEIGFDKKMNCIVLPITSRTGSVLGFTKRRIDFLHENNRDENGKFRFPKWFHSTIDNSLIGICHNIFNLQHASSAMKKTNNVIITEGPKDVIAYERIKNQEAICCCGTNNITNIFDEILPIKNITLSMDSDAAGLKAIKEVALFLAPIHDIRRIHVVSLPEEKDPYDISSNELSECYKARMPILYFLLDHFDDASFMKEFYDKVPEYAKMYIIKGICKKKLFSASEAKSWLESAKDYKEKEKVELSEQEELLAIVNGTSDNSYINPIKAKKILRIKYGLDA